MVKVSINGEEKYFDGMLKDSMTVLHEFVEKKWDGVIFIGGYEGDAKSTLASQLAYLVDPTYCLDRCVFTPEQFREQVLSAKPFQAIVYDEAQSVFESTNRTKEAMVTKDLMTRIRRRRLFIFICAPDFWRINKYLFIHRSRAFIHVYASGTTRGFFKFYNRQRKHALFLKGKRDENIKAVPPNFRGRFTNWWPFDEEVYDKKKEKSEGSVVDAYENKKSYEYLEEAIVCSTDITLKAKAALLEVTERTISRKKLELINRQQTTDTRSNNLIQGAE